MRYWNTVVAAGVMLVLASLAPAATINVPADRPTIRAAITAAAPGDTVLVAPGTYWEAIDINKPMTIRSSAGAAATVLDGNSASENYYMVDIEAGNVVLDGFTITNPVYAGTADASGIVIGMNSRPANVRVTNCIIRDLGIPGRAPCSFGTFGINCGPVDGLEIDHCQIYNIGNGDPGAWAVGIFTWGNDSVQTADNIRIHDNNIHDIVCQGPFVNAISIGGASADAVIQNNTLAGPMGNGVTTSAGAEPGTVTISGNTITGASQYGLWLRSPHATTVSGNTISGCGEAVHVTAAATTTPVLHLNGLAGNAVAINSEASGLVDAERNWWGSSSGPSSGQVLGNVDYDPWLTGWPLNILSLDAPAESLYVRPGELVLIDMNVSNLAQMINGCQALLGFSSTYLTAGAGCVVPGGGVWTELIYNSWDVGRGVPGEIDTAIGVKLGAEGDLGPAGTNADGTVAILSLTAGSTDGTTQVVFRPNGESGYATMFSDLNAQPVWPNKVNSANIVIDGTPPALVTVPADGTTTAVTVAQQTITGTVSDNLAGLERLTCSFNGAPATVVPVTAGAFSQLVTLVPGANTAVFTAIDRAGNAATSTVNYTYTQPAPTVEVLRSLAPNKYGSPSWGAWLANAVEGAKNRSAQGTGYTRFEDFGNDSQDYSSVMVSASQSWKGLLSTDPEYGTAIHFVWRLDNGVESNPGAAKLDVTRINITFNDIWLGADAVAGNLTTDCSGWWNDIAAGASFGGTSGFRSGLKGFNWDGSQWVPVTSGTQADLIIYAWFRYAQEPQGNPSTPDQTVLNTLYKQMSGAAAFAGDPRRTLDHQEIEVRYSEHAGVIDGTSGSLTTAYRTVEETDPVVTITAPADGAEVNVAAQTITGLVTDAGTLDSGVREVAITLNSTVVYTDRMADPVSFSQAVNLVEGENTITVAAEDFAGNTAGRTIRVYLDTAPPALTIDSATQGGSELLISKGSTINAVQGAVTITVSSSDAPPSTGLVVPPAVKVTDANGVETVLTAAGSGPWTYAYAVSSATANGQAVISASIGDEAGNTTTASDRFQVNKNQITGQVQLEGFTGTGTSPRHTREVKFVATGGTASKTWILALSNTAGAVFDYTLTDVPAGTTGISADTAWSLREKLTVTLDADGQARDVNFLGDGVAGWSDVSDHYLRGGDLNGDNMVNILDYSVLKAKWFTIAPQADVNGDGLVNTLDYSIQKANWFLRGDAE